MSRIQHAQNPDVNSIPSDDDFGSTEQEIPDRNNYGDVERPDDDDVIPVPPDVRPISPIEEPPERDQSPVGDVDDSPRRIAGDE